MHRRPDSAIRGHLIFPLMMGHSHPQVARQQDIATSRATGQLHSMGSLACSLLKLLGVPQQAPKRTQHH
jgi:hypothetical protein